MKKAILFLIIAYVSISLFTIKILHDEKLNTSNHVTITKFNALQVNYPEFIYECNPVKGDTPKDSAIVMDSVYKYFSHRMAIDTTAVNSIAKYFKCKQDLYLSASPDTVPKFKVEICDRAIFIPELTENDFIEAHYARQDYLTLLVYPKFRRDFYLPGINKKSEFAFYLRRDTVFIAYTK